MPRRHLPWLALCAAAIAMSGAGLPAPAGATPRAWRGGVRATLRAAREARPEKAPAVRFGGVPKITGAGVTGYVTFTFDDGPHHTTTPRILDALAAHELRASFFVVGYKWSSKRKAAPKNRKVLEAIAAAGHLVGNHTYDHENIGLLELADAWDTIRRTDQAIDAVLGPGPRPKLFRPPYRGLTDESRQLLRDLGYTLVLWNIDTLDFYEHDPKVIRDQMMEKIVARGGGVVILHDRHKATAAAFPMILADLEQHNCKQLRKGREPILPVELDYFAIGSDGLPVPVPAGVARRTQATRERLERRCALD